MDVWKIGPALFISRTLPGFLSTHETHVIVQYNVVLCSPFHFTQSYSTSVSESRKLGIVGSTTAIA